MTAEDLDNLEDLLAAHRIRLPRHVLARLYESDPALWDACNSV